MFEMAESLDLVRNAEVGVDGGNNKDKMELLLAIQELVDNTETRHRASFDSILSTRNNSVDTNDILLEDINKITRRRREFVRDAEGKKLSIYVEVAEQQSRKSFLVSLPIIGQHKYRQKRCKSCVRDKMEKITQCLCFDCHENTCCTIL